MNQRNKITYHREYPDYLKGIHSYKYTYSDDIQQDAFRYKQRKFNIKTKYTQIISDLQYIKKQNKGFLKNLQDARRINKQLVEVINFISETYQKQITVLKNQNKSLKEKIKLHNTQILLEPQDKLNSQTLIQINNELLNPSLTIPTAKVQSQNEIKESLQLKYQTFIHKEKQPILKQQIAINDSFNTPKKQNQDIYQQVDDNSIDVLAIKQPEYCQKYGVIDDGSHYLTYRDNQQSFGELTFKNSSQMKKQQVSNHNNTYSIFIEKYRSPYRNYDITKNIRGQKGTLKNYNWDLKMKSDYYYKEYKY